MKTQLFLWPLWKFWKYTPGAFVLASIWNCCELIRVPMPFSGWAFGVIVGYKGKKVKK